MRCIRIALALLLSVWPGQSVSVATAQFDNARTNANTSEVVLTQSNVVAGQFGYLGAWTIDGYAYAQPLLIENACGVSLCLIVATMHNSVYAFDANAPNTPALWHVNNGATLTSYAGISDGFTYMAEIGCWATPVVSGGVVYETCVDSSGNWHLYSWNIKDGSTFHSSVTISGTNNGITFNSVRHMQRTPLTLANGNVYFGFSGWADTTPYQGWVFSYSATDLSFQNAWCDVNTSNGQGGIWMGGGGISVDGSGNLYLATGNGSFDGTSNYGSSVVKLSPALAVLDYATPSNWATLNSTDKDVGSSRAILQGTYVVAGGKDARVWLLNQGALGHLQGGGGNPPIAQVFQPMTGGNYGGQVWVGATNTLYLSGVADHIILLPFSSGMFATSPTIQSVSTFAFPGATMSYSSNGSTAGTGIVWAVTVASNSNHTIQAGTLRAFNGDTLVELWNSGTQLGNYAKFSSPVVADGKVFVSTFSNQVQVYGIVSYPNSIPAAVGGGLHE